MNSRTLNRVSSVQTRRGSTLLIVLSLLSILAFLGMVFFTIASQERASAEYFSEAAKNEVETPDDPLPYGLRHILVGPGNFEKGSILHSPTNRHAMITNMVGDDLAPFTGTGNKVIYDSGLPVIDNDNDTVADTFGNAFSNPLNFVDSLVAWANAGVNEDGLRQARLLFPKPDVPYTYPDINNLFLSYKGWAIRDNGAGISDPTLRYERVPVIIPSFFRPSLLKSSGSNGFGGTNTLTDFDWYNEAAHPQYVSRLMRPHAEHIVGVTGAGVPVRRFLDAQNPAHSATIAGLPGASGPFPLRRSEGGNSANFGKLGLWTGDLLFDPMSPPVVTDGIPSQFAEGFELDSDNDRDGVKEGIWLDLAYPMESTSGGINYVTLFSFTIADLDSLIDLNVHGNMAEVPRSANVGALVGAGNVLATTAVSGSNQGLSPVEVSPVPALYPPGAAADTGAEFTDWYGANPANRLEQANMELMWLLTGRIDRSSGALATYQVHAGKWGDETALWYHAVNPGARNVSSLPRPGRSGNLAVASASGIDFGGQQGFDDNQDLFEGIAKQANGSSPANGVVRGFVHPLDISGRGQISITGDPRIPNLFNDVSTSPSRWLRYFQYPLVGAVGSLENDSPYVLGRDAAFTGAGDDLVTSASFNYALDDPAEVIFDNDRTLRPEDALFGPGDSAVAHLVDADIFDSQTSLSNRLQNLAPYAFAPDSGIKERFTTLTNSLRYFPLPHQLGADLLPDAISGGTDDGPRSWEWSADSDGTDDGQHGNTSGDGIPDGDGRFEFPPKFGAIQPYSSLDPFRVVTRRLLMTEVGDRGALNGQLPLSVNHLLDVNRSAQTPPETNPAAFLRFLRRSGMRFRELTEHPDADETDSGGNTAAALTSVPDSSTAAGQTARQTFPPRTFAQREFWARRDRQQMARDIYVLLYTIGGAELSGSNVIDYTGDNSARALYSNHQLRRMAQFAVNLVDAMDTDNVITKFEYDKNLNNGWNLDDDAFTDDGFAAAAVPSAPESILTSDTGNGLYPEDSATDRGVVYGVEAQQLAFSEALAVYSERFLGGNLTETPYDDIAAHRLFLHLELQNMQPYSVPLARAEVGSVDEEKAIWRLLRIDREDSTGSPRSTFPQVDTPNNEFSLMNGNNDVPGGGTFTIGIASEQGAPGNTDPTGFGTADIYVDDDNDGAFTLISPDIGAQTATIALGTTPAPNCDLDTVHMRDRTKFLANGSVQSGAFLEGVIDTASNVPKEYHGNAEYDFAPVGGPTEGGFEVVLQRRANPNLPSLPLAENPFVEVDRISVSLSKLIDLSGMTPTVDLSKLKSVERREPLDSGSTSTLAHEPLAPGVNWRQNSIGALMNDVTDDPTGTTFDGMGVFDLWQVHFDRDYGNPGELLTLPVVPPRLLTTRLDRMRQAPYQQSDRNEGTGTVTLEEEWISTAEAMFLQPEFQTTVPPAIPTSDDNRWYRLLQFLEVPSRLNTTLGNYLALNRTPGKVNLNGIRHIEVYAGLIDDQTFASLPYRRDPPDITSPFDADNRYAPFMQNSTPGNASVTTVTGVDAVLPFKDRWFEFISQRDGMTSTFDALLGGVTDFWIPGTPNAKPFHPFGYTLQSDVTQSTVSEPNRGDNGFEQSILRRAEIDVVGAPNDENRNWLEVGSLAFHQGPNAQSNGLMRNQLVSKLLNNTTTTSNVFVVYVTAAYFEAAEDTNGFVQVGGRLDLDGDTVTNGVSADTTSGWEKRAVFIIDRTEAYNAFDPASGSFDWQRLIKYRADLGTDGM
ncbi:MAG: hypothetical protein R3C59_25730 [Planctomycetaceae bacterium]